ncbi:hypothetical protein [Polaribacter sp. Asnod6-C07]|uniref:hypothetical protein n=1 Tax=Polaribacter sp. Asnod6-C07 TaxID=3160582 RepID=UPI003869A79E
MNKLLFEDKIDWLKKEKRTNEWTTIYKNIRDDENEENIFAIIFPENLRNNFLEHSSWTLNSTQFKPEFVHAFGEKPEYQRWGIESKYEPIIFQRFYNKIYPTKIELIEEFRLYYNLYFDEKNNEYISVDLYSKETVIVKFTSEEIKVKTDSLRKFLFAKKFILGIQIDDFRFSASNLEDYNLKEEDYFHKTTNQYCYNIDFQKSTWSNNPNKKINSRLLAKCIIEGYKNLDIKTDYEESENEESCSFIVALDLDLGIPILENCNKSKFDNEQDKYGYFTPISFSRDVLTKYFQNPNRFSIEDNSVKLKGSWRLDIDNNIDDCIIVYLGDLRTIPYEEQLYWKSFNINPKQGISKRKFQIDFLSEYVEPEIEDLKFKNEYININKEWNNTFGFKLFTDFDSDDVHCFKSLRIPLKNDKSEFDNLILNLAKVFIDYINIKEINNHISTESKSLNSIEKLRIYLENLSNKEQPEIISFFKDLHKLRSVGSAHRKSSDYNKILKKMSIQNKSEIESFKSILKRGISTINLLRNIIEK